MSTIKHSQWTYLIDIWRSKLCIKKVFLKIGLNVNLNILGVLLAIQNQVSEINSSYILTTKDTNIPIPVSEIIFSDSVAGEVVSQW